MDTKFARRHKWYEWHKWAQVGTKWLGVVIPCFHYLTKITPLVKVASKSIKN